MLWLCGPLYICGTSYIQKRTNAHTSAKCTYSVTVEQLSAISCLTLFEGSLWTWCLLLGNNSVLIWFTVSRTCWSAHSDRDLIWGCNLWYPKVWKRQFVEILGKLFKWPMLCVYCCQQMMRCCYMHSQPSLPSVWWVCHEQVLPCSLFWFLNAIQSLSRWNAWKLANTVLMILTGQLI